MIMISNDRFPDEAMSTQGVSSFHDDSLGEMVDPVDGVYHGQNQIEIGPNGGMTWSRARPGPNGTFHQNGGNYPGNTLARPS